MLKLHLGFDKEIVRPKGAYLWLGDEVKGDRWSQFDPNHDSFNALGNMTPRKARDLAEVVYSLWPASTTLTVRNGKRALAKMLRKAERLDKLAKPENAYEEEAIAAVEDVLFTPLARRVLCGSKELGDGKILARLNRAELGDFDTLAIGLFLIGQYQGQTVIKDFGFFGRDVHVSLINENRLIAGVNYLGELPERLRKEVLRIEDKVGRGCLPEDAELLAKFAGLRPDFLREDNAHKRFVDKAIGVRL